MTDVDRALQQLRSTAADVVADLRRNEGQAAVRLAMRLESSVLGPLHPGRDDAARDGDIPVGIEQSEGAGEGRPADAGVPTGFVEQVRELARLATQLYRQDTDLPGVAEAAAALQDVALDLSDDAQGAIWLAEMNADMAGLSRRIQAIADGPYVTTNVTQLDDYLGCALGTRPVMALCRCGQSGIKPTCDGVCHQIGFTTAKDPARIPNRLDTHIGQSVTVLDNRGTCQHSGRCTDRLASVFRSGKDPFVAPSGGRLDEIVRAVRDCPSGALSYAIDDVEARDQVDHAGKRAPAIEVSKDGPYRVTGGIALVDGDAQDMARNDGASREHYALCRCGHSQNKPFCSGMHWYVNFTDPVSDPEATPSIFAWCGGLPALTRMTRLFYEKYVPADPLLAPIFAHMSADHPQRVAKWLGEVFGGPTCYSDEYGGYTRMISEHVGRMLTDEWRARWVELMLRSAQEAGLPNDAEFRSAFSAYLEWGSRLAVENSQAEAHPPAHMPMPHWTWTTGAGAPGGRISALAPPVPAHDDSPSVLPPADEPVRFDLHIKPMFRTTDRKSMSFVFDLWSFDDVRTHADAIHTRLANGTMPCDGPWPADKITTFRRWIDTGMNA